MIKKLMICTAKNFMVMSNHYFNLSIKIDKLKIEVAPYLFKNCNW
jgi:hypothetical protein